MSDTAGNTVPPLVEKAWTECSLPTQGGGRSTRKKLKEGLTRRKEREKVDHESVRNENARV